MVQHNNEHPTTTQLSAYVDQELTGDELTLCAAHLQTCQECQATLADLRLISTLLHEMPEVEVPRSFVLPLNISVLPVTPVHATARAPQVRKGQIIIRRTLRAMSTIAAVVGLVFILFGAFASLSFPQTSMNSASMTSAQNRSSIAAGRNTPDMRATQKAEETQPNATRAAATHSPLSTPAVVPTLSALHQPPEHQLATPLPSALDLSQPEIRLGLGVLLFILGALGVLATRRKQPKPAH